MVERNVSVRLVAEGGRAVKAEFTDIGREGARAFDQIRRSGGSSGQALQNVGFQVQDFAVQVAGGTSASRALAQQLPQLLSGFGLLGVGLGTAAAILVPFVGHLLEGEDAAEGLDDSLSELARTSKAYAEAVQLASTPLIALEKQFGRNANAVRELYDAQVNLARFDFLRAQTSGVESIRGVLQEVADQVGRINTITTEAFDLSVQVGVLAELQMRTGDLERTFGLTVDEANNLVEALNALDTTNGPQAAFDSAAALQRALLAAADASGKLPPELEAAYRAATDLQSAALETGLEIDEAAQAGGRLNDTNMSDGLRDALSVAQQLALATREALFPKRTERGDPRQFVKDEYYRNRFFPDPEKPDTGPAQAGGGISVAQKEQNDILRDAERIYDQTRTSAEKFRIEKEKLDKVFAATGFEGQGGIETYNRALEGLKERFGDLDDEASKTKDAFKDFFGSIIDGSASAEEALSSLLASFADQLLGAGLDSIFNLPGVDSLISGLFPNATGNAFQAGNVIPFARGGVVSSPTLFPMRKHVGLMGEAGPEAIMPLTRGTDGRLGVAATGLVDSGPAITMNISIDAQGATEGVAAQIDRALQVRMPAIVNQTVAAVAAARKRGRNV